jgi:hypothetical protein
MKASNQYFKTIYNINNMCKKIVPHFLCKCLQWVCLYSKLMEQRQVSDEISFLIRFMRAHVAMKLRFFATLKSHMVS